MNLLDRAENRTLLPVLDALDAVRLHLLKRTRAITAPFVRDRDHRVIAAALLSCTVALIGTVLAPGYMLLLGPVLLGMPHLCFEARYLFFQRVQLRRAALIALLVAQTVLVFNGLGIYTLGVAALGALGLSGALATRRGVLLACLAVGAQGAALVGPAWSRFALLHGHNCIPLVVWWLWRPRPARVSLAVAAIFVVAVATILLGAFDAMPLRRPFAENVFSIVPITDAVAVDLGGAWRQRMLLFFTFTQAFHYMVWLRLIPEESRERPTPRSWRASWKAFKDDSGATVARLSLALAVAVPVAALAIGVVRTRALYVTASEFHATVEAILVVLVWGSSGSPQSCTRSRILFK